MTENTSAPVEASNAAFPAGVWSSKRLCSLPFGRAPKMR
jgi:hypothetical protein